ncbi:MAG: starch-binding protein [Muribaculaceae bacterium]|nr:starch-binding protein [Muribaculaceae bacterium]
MIRKISTYLLAFVLIALTACRDEFSSPTGGGVDDDGNLHISFSLSDMEVVSTRATDGISSIQMYAFDKNSPYLLRQTATVEITEGWTSNSNTCKGTVLLNNNVMSNLASTDFVFVANHASVTCNNYNDLKGTMTSALENGGVYILSSKPESLSAVETNTVALLHNAVKITVNQAKKDNNGNFLKNGSDYVLGDNYDFNVAGAAQESSVVAGGESLIGNPVAQSYKDFTLSSGEKLIHSTKNTGTGTANSVYVIVKAKYLNKDYYYRLDFQKSEKVDDDDSDELSSGNITTKPFDVLPNHWYQFVIKNVIGAGYDTPEEAAKNPTPMIDYEIHDHSPKIFNMISDGSRELGVSKAVTNQNAAINSTETLYVKLFSLNKGEDSELTFENWEDFIKIDEDCDWLTVSAITSNTTDVGDDNPDKNDTGKLYDVELKFLSTKNPGKLETTISVTWRGLTRDVPVVWNREFDSSDLFSSVKIKAYTGQPSSWSTGSFWGGNDGYEYFTYTPENSTTEKGFFKEYAYGTTAQQNNGQDREDGFHFPMPYGDPTHYKYMYKVTINSNLVTSGQKWSVTSEDIDGVEFSLNGSSSWATSLKDISANQNVFYIRSNDESYDYKIGKLVLKVTDGINEATYDNVKIYHTGFFYQDKAYPTNQDTSSSFIKDGSAHTGLAYYEVVTCGQDHWLDRNIGAEAANSYIINGLGTDDSAGYYVVAAKYYLHNDPIIYEGMCPPGYTVPSVDQWDNLRNSDNFTITLFGSNYNPSFAGEKGKVMFFPKAQYLEGSSYQGEERAGYYWTRTAATGTEKEEIGNWLKCLSIAGTATSYINGKVRGKGSENPYYMSLRAVTPEKAGGKVNRVSFFVTGATHVYLYTEDGTNARNAVTEWPGQAVGNYLTMVDNQRFNFTYESKVVSIEDLKVIFNYVDGNGTIHTYSKNNFTAGTTHTNILPKNAQGWDVKGSSQTNDFESQYIDCQVKINTAVSDNNTVWACGGQDFGQVEAKRYRLLWPQTEEGYKYLTMYNGTEKYVDNKAPTNENYEYDSKKYYCYDFSTKKEELTFKLKFATSSGEVVTGQGDQTYTLASFDTSINGVQGIVVESLTGGTPVKDYQCRIYWYHYDYRKFYQWASGNSNGLNLPSELDGTQSSDYPQYYYKDFQVNSIQMGATYNYEFKYTKNDNSEGSIKEEKVGTIEAVFGKSADAINCAYVDKDGKWHKGTPGSGGGDNPNPPVSEYTYALYGEIIGGSNNWTAKEMTQNADGTWTVSNYSFKSGGFGIQKLKDGSQVEWINASGTNNIGSSGGTYGTKTDGSNFNLQTAGTYTFTYNPASNQLKVEKGQVDNYTIYYTNPENWSNVYVYSYDGDKKEYSGGWPGTQIYKDGGNYKAVIDGKATMVIFTNNSGQQTNDLVLENNKTYTDKAK